MVLAKYKEHRKALLQYAESSRNHPSQLPTNEEIMVLCSACFNILKYSKTKSFQSKQANSLRVYKSIIEYLSYPNTSIAEKKFILKNKISAKKRSIFIKILIKYIDKLIVQNKIK